MPSSIVGPTDNKPPIAAQVPYAQDLLAPMDINMPDVTPELVEMLGDQWLSSYGQIMRSMGFEKPATQETFKHYYDDLYVRKTRTGASISAGTGAAGATFTVPINAADIYTVGGVPYTYLRKGQQLMFPVSLTGGVIYRAHVVDVDPTAPDVDLKLNDVTQSLPALASGVNLIPYTSAYAEGSGQPTASLRNINNRTGNLQIIKGTFATTGSALTDGKWFKRTQDGEDIFIFVSYGMKQVAYEMSKDEDGALMFGDFTTTTITNPLTDPYSINGTIKTTEGLYTAINKRGRVLSYNIGSFDITDLNTAGQVSETENSGAYQCVFHSYTLGTELEDVLKDTVKEAAIKFVFGERSKYIVDIGFSGIKKNGIQYIFKPLNVLSHPELYGAAGYEDLQNMAIVLPIKRVKAYENEDRSEPSHLPTFGIRYKKLGAYNRRSQAWEIDGTGHKAAQRMLSQYDVAHLYMRAHVGGQYMNENQMQLWKGVL